MASVVVYMRVNAIQIKGYQQPVKSLAMCKHSTDQWVPTTNKMLTMCKHSTEQTQLQDIVTDLEIVAKGKYLAAMYTG